VVGEELSIVLIKIKGKEFYYWRNEDIMIGSTPFRRNIFNKHHIDKNAMIIKSGMTASVKDVMPGGNQPGGSTNNLKLGL
jgi:hypothetical protein